MVRRSAEAREEADRSFERLYRGHRDDVFRAALRDLKNVHDAEDVTQAAFIDAYRAVLRGSKPEAPRAWLLAIAENVRRRRYRRALRGPREEPLDEEVAPAKAESPFETEELRGALAELPRAQQEVFVLRELSGLSYDEIAKLKGTTVASVQMSLFRARQTLRGSLEPPTVARRGRVLMPFPGWLAQFVGRADTALLTPRGFAAAGAAAVALGGFAAQVDEPRAESRQTPVALEQPAATVPAPAQRAVPARPTPRQAVEPAARASRSATAAPSRTQPSAKAAAPAPAEQPAAPGPASVAPAAQPPAVTPPPAAGSDTPTAPRPAPQPRTQSPQAPAVVVTVPLATPAVTLPQLPLPQLPVPQLPQITVPSITVPSVTVPPVAVPPLPLPQVEPVLAPVVKQVEGAAGAAGVVAPPLPSNPLDALPPALPSVP